MIYFRLRTLFPISRAVSRKMQQWSIKCARGEFWGAITHKAQQCSVTCPRLFIWFKFDKTFVGSSTEAKRNHKFFSPSAHKLTTIRGQPTPIQLDQVFNTPRDKESNDLNAIYRVYLHRANILMPLLRLMQNRATNLFKWAMMKFIVKPNSTASVDSQGDGV